jgi:tetratricopeptide (TPR) repeat protein
MKALIVASLLFGACRGDHHDAGPAPASAVSGSAVPSTKVPKVPFTDDGRAELRGLDQRVAKHADEPPQELELLLERASYRGRLEDFQNAVALAGKLVAVPDPNIDAWKREVRALSAVHDFKGARAALEHVKPLARDPSEWQGLEATLDEATGDFARSTPVREAATQGFPNASKLTQLAASYAAQGRTQEAIALIPKAAAAIHNNPPGFIAWLLFQWGRVYELAGETATARDFFAEAHAKLPGYLEVTAHLAQTMAATGDRDGAKKVVDEALADSRHPELLGLAVQLGQTELTDEAKREWERYVAALPLAFSDHAARFYLTVDPARALVLAKVNRANRDTPEARALVGEAALAAGDPGAACTAVAPLVDGKAPKAQRFIAWRALTKCGNTQEAERLARDLGIAQ